MTEEVKTTETDVCVIKEIVKPDGRVETVVEMKYTFEELMNGDHIRSVQ